MLADEAFLAVSTLELSIAEMSLDVGLDVLFPSKALVTVGIHAQPFSVLGIRARNEASNIINGDAGLCEDFVKVKIDAGYRLGSPVRRCVNRRVSSLRTKG